VSVVQSGISECTFIGPGPRFIVAVALIFRFQAFCVSP
jgi:hypothetical protein